MMPSFDLLFRELESLITCVLIACIMLAFALQVCTAAFRGDHAFFATPIGLGMTAMMLKNFGEWLDNTWVWLIQYSRVAGFQAKFDPATLLYAGYVGLGFLIVGSLLLIRVLSPVTWGHRGWLAATALTALVVLATHLPFAHHIIAGLARAGSSTP